jgi:hypothetical protein
MKANVDQSINYIKRVTGLQLTKADLFENKNGEITFKVTGGNFTLQTALQATFMTLGLPTSNHSTCSINDRRWDFGAGRSLGFEYSANGNFVTLRDPN